MGFLKRINLDELEPFLYEKTNEQYIVLIAVIIILFFYSLISLIPFTANLNLLLEENKISCTKSIDFSKGNLLGDIESIKIISIKQEEAIFIGYDINSKNLKEYNIKYDYNGENTRYYLDKIQNNINRLQYKKMYVEEGISIKKIEIE
ncbi:MAG: hypothetical protein ACRCYE_02765 [Sarcina sp.]